MSFDYNRTITLRARPATVWRFFSEPEMFARWWGAGSSIEARVGAHAHRLSRREHGLG